MSLKRIINQSKLLKTIVNGEMVLPGEPMIYSIKYSIASNTRSVQFYRNAKWKSLLKCHFRSFYNTNTPVVVVVKFYVSPPESSVSSANALKGKTPATKSYELCDYLLSFLEMLHHVLINSYRQVVKIDAVKFYSDNPRTVFKFMRWEEYVKLQSNNPVHSEAERVSTDGKVEFLQPIRKRNEGSS